MPSSGLEWKLNEPTAIQEKIAGRLAETAKSRQVVPKGPDSIGRQAVVVPTLLPGPPVQYGAERIVTPVHVYVDIMLNDQQAAHPASFQNAIGSAAAQLGVIEDEEVLQGAVGALPAPAPPPAAAPPLGRFARNVNLARDGIAGGPGVVAALVPLPGPTVILAGPGVNPNGDQLNVAIINAVAQLQLRNRPGRLGLLVSHNLMATMQLARPTVPGGPPLIREVEARIGKTIVATSALALPPVLPALPGICGVLLLLDPAAADVVHTQLPTVTVLGRAGGLTYLRVEEEIAVRLLDPTAIQTIQY
jgi:hypothetical protein